MTSADRREIRYRNRQRKRKQNAIRRANTLPTFEEIFSFNNMWKYGKQCCKGVRWKASTQLFEVHMFSTTTKNISKLKTGTWKARKCNHFTINERGKTREIDAPCIQDRQIHKAYTKSFLRAAYNDILIYDNSASRIGFGLHFAYRRVKKKAHEAYKRWGNGAAVIHLDLKSFFASAPRDNIKSIHNRYIQDDKLRNFANKVIEDVPEASPGKGLPLGVEPSQQEMLMLTANADNYITCQLHCGLMARFMDDYIIFVQDKITGKQLLKRILQVFQENDIPCNASKCYVCSLLVPNWFCKVRYTVLPSNKVVLNGCGKGAIRFRRKIRGLTHTPTRRSFLRDCVHCHLSYYDTFHEYMRQFNMKKYLQNKVPFQS